MLLNVVSHYDLSVLSMSVIGFQKKLDRGVGGVSSIQLFFDFWNFFNFAKPFMGISQGRNSQQTCSECIGGWWSSCHHFRKDKSIR